MSFVPVNRVLIDLHPGVHPQTPASFGIASPSSVFPEIETRRRRLLFGGISGFPQGRGYSTTNPVQRYALPGSRVNKSPSSSAAELRHFNNDNFNGGTGGVINFAQLGIVPDGHAQPKATEMVLAANPALAVTAIGFFAYRTISKLS